MINDMTELLFLVNFVIFCCICIPYEFMWLIRPRKGRVVNGVTNAFVYSAGFTVLVVKAWYIAVIVWLLFGFWVTSRIRNRGGRKVVICVFLVVGILLAVIGIGNSEQSTNDNAQDQSYEDDYYDADTEDNYYDTANDYYDTEYDVEDTEYSEEWSENSDSAEMVSDQSNQGGISEELQWVEEKAQELQNELQNDSLSNVEMLQVSEDLYMLWDDELNSLWTRLKNTLDTDDMDRLTKEEREWIKEKERKIKEAGSEWEGGSGQQLAENTEGAELTRERVYELAEYLE